jgi:hypothetical protein
MFNQWTQFYWSKLPGNIGESSVYISLSVFIIIGYVWMQRKAMDDLTKRQLYLWSAVMAFFFLLSLGPDLQVAGTIVWHKFMPYSLLVKVLPFLRLSGVPVRMMVMVILCASVLSAMGLREIFRRFPQKRVFVFLLLGILLFESLPSPLPATRLEIPDYVTALSRLPNDGGVVDLVTEGFSTPLYYQIIHGKPIAFGYVSRLPASIRDKDKLLDKTIQYRNYGKLWATYHIRYIITHNVIQAQDLQPYITIQAVYDSNDIRIYRIGCVCEGKK